ncbi:MAG TPA: class I SAM-dependent methyltransferase [Phycisphaerales bacterium]|nr:class I SAM-dependent methyltransferase [Phycisphaerales bacterium]
MTQGKGPSRQGAGEPEKPRLGLGGRPVGPPGSLRDGPVKPQGTGSRAAPPPRTLSAPSGGSAPGQRGAPFNLPALELMTTTLWSYPSQHYWSPTQRKMIGVAGAKYTGATPSWVIWQLLMRYTREGEDVLDPMVGSGTTLDVCADLGRNGGGFDLNPQRPEIKLNDARTLPLKAETVDFVFIDPPYSTHVNYSDDPRCIGKLDSGGSDAGKSYYEAMTKVTREIARVLRPGRHMALYVSDSHVKGRGDRGFMPIGFELFEIMRRAWSAGGAGLLTVDIVAVERGNQKLSRGNWHKAAEEGNFFLRGFNYLFIMKKPEAPARKG